MRANVRPDLDPDAAADPKTLPTPGQILAEMSANQVGGEKYDREMARACAPDDVVIFSSLIRPLTVAQLADCSSNAFSETLATPAQCLAIGTSRRPYHARFRRDCRQVAP